MNCMSCLGVVVRLNFFRGFNLAHKWDDLAREKNLNDETLKNIVIELEQDKVGLEWLERRRHPLAPMQRGLNRLQVSTLRLWRSLPKLVSVPWRHHPCCSSASKSQQR